MINTLRERLGELNPRDTFELGMYRFVAWAAGDGGDGYHKTRLLVWADILQELSTELRKAANR